MATYTVEQAREIWEKDGDAWTPEVEARLRERGIIADPVPALAAPASAPNLPWWQELGLGLASAISPPASGLPGAFDAAQRIATGTTMGEQATSGALSGLTAGNLSPETLGIPAPTSVVQRGANLFGQGAGMAAAFTPLARGAGAATAGIANPLLRSAATGAASFGAYSAAAPAEDIGQRLQNVGEGALTGAVLGPLPLLPGVRKFVAMPGGRTALDQAAFTTLGTVHRMREPGFEISDLPEAIGESALEALPQLGAMRLVHMAGESPRRPGLAISERPQGEIVAPEVRLPNDQAAMQPEMRPAESLPTEARSALQGPAEAMPADRPISGQPVAAAMRQPAQMEIPLEAPPAKETRGQRRARLQAEAAAVNAEAQAKMDAAAAEAPPAPATGGGIIDKITQVKGRVRWDSEKWARATEELTAELPEHPTANIVRDYALRKKDYRTTINELASQDQAVRGLDTLPKTDTPEGRAQAIAMLESDIAKTPEGQALVDMISGGKIKDRPASSGMTSPPQIIASHTGTVGDPYTANLIGGARMFDRALHVRIAEYVEMRNDLIERTGVKSKSDRQIAERLRDTYDPEMPRSDFLGLPEVQALLNKSSVGPEKMLEFVESSRAMMDESRLDLNTIAEAYGTREMGYIEGGYSPHYVEPTRNPVERLRRAAAGQQHTGGGQPTMPQEVYNPSRRQRLGTDPETIEVGGRKLPRDWDAIRVMDQYMLRNIQTMFGEVALANDMKIAKLLELNGRPEAAQDVANVARQRWTSQQWGSGRDFDAALRKSSGGRAILEALTLNKRQFDKTKYTGNPVFPVSTQWTSIIPAAFANPRAAAIVAARGDMINQAARDWAKATYTATKKRTSGKPVDSAVGGKMLEKYQQGAAKAWEQAGGALVKAVEEFSMDYAALVARESKTAKRLGGRFGERARNMYADTDAGTTQGMFNRADREEILNSRLVQGTIPAQGYGLAQIRRVAEDVGRVGVDPAEVGIGKTEAVARATSRMTGVIVASIISSAMRQMIWQTLLSGDVADPEELDWDQIALDATTSAVPFASTIAGTGPSEGATLPAGQAKWVGRGMASAARDVVRDEVDKETVAKIVAPIASNWGGQGGVPFSYAVRKWAQDDEGAEPSGRPARSRPAAPSASRGRRAIPRGDRS